MLKTLLGQSAEARAEAFLITQGLASVARNWRCRFGGAAASVTPAKQRKLLAAARQYLSGLKTLPPCRFDVIALDAGGAPDRIKNAFDDVG